MKNHFRICLYLIIWFTGFTTQSKAQDSSTVRPIRLSLHHGGQQSLDGSSPNGGCTSVNVGGDICNLQDGGTSVLVDNTILPLNGLNGDWARDLYTVNRTAGTSTLISIGFDFGTSVPVRRVELVLFNCPQRSIRAGSIQIYTDGVTNHFPQLDPMSVGTFAGDRLFGVGVNSCAKLYRVCVSLTGANNRIYYIVFPHSAGSNRVYLAETIFYNDTRTCGDDTLVTEPVTTPPVDTTTEGTTIVMQDTTTTPGSTTIKDSTTTQSKKDTTSVQTVITTTIQMKMNITTQDTTTTLGSASTTTESKKDTTSAQTVNNTTTQVETDTTNNNTVTVTVIATVAALSLLALITGVIITVIIVIVVRLKTQTNEKSGTNNHTHLNNSCNEESQTVELQCIGTANTNKSPKFSTTIITQEDNNTLPVRLEEMHFTVQKSGKPKKKKARSESPPPIPPYRGGDVYAVVQKKRKRKTEDDGKPPPVPPQTTEMLYAAVHKKK